MATSEDSLCAELRDALQKRKPMAFVYKLHGGPYQPGLPDLLVGMERAAALVEAKWASDSDFDRPLLEACASKLTPQQAANLNTLGTIDGPLRARVLIGGSIISDELPHGKGTLCVAYDLANVQKLSQYHTLTMLEIATYLMDLRRGERTTFPPAYLFQAQICGHGETWMAGHLLVGIQYFGPINAATDKDKTFEDA